LTAITRKRLKQKPIFLLAIWPEPPTLSSANQKQFNHANTQRPQIKIFADGADKKGMLELNANPLIQGLTTNPTLMRKVGITDFEAFARDILQSVTVKPISLEVFPTNFRNERQAIKINGWAKNVYVKIPTPNTRGESFAAAGERTRGRRREIKCHGHFDFGAGRRRREIPGRESSAVVSVFAGRIADTGVDPVPHMIECKKILQRNSGGGIALGQRARSLNIFQADDCGCDIVTVPHDIEQASNLRESA